MILQLALGLILILVCVSVPVWHMAFISIYLEDFPKTWATNPKISHRTLIFQKSQSKAPR